MELSTAWITLFKFILSLKMKIELNFYAPTFKMKYVVPPLKQLWRLIEALQSLNSSTVCLRKLLAQFLNHFILFNKKKTLPTSCRLMIFKLNKLFLGMEYCNPSIIHDTYKNCHIIAFLTLSISFSAKSLTCIRTLFSTTMNI